MDSKKLADLLTELTALQDTATSSDYQQGVADARVLIEARLTEALDREKMARLEAELSALKSKYPEPERKKRGRKPKQAAEKTA